MAPASDAGLTASDVQRWLRGLQLFHVERLLLALIFLALGTYSWFVPGDLPCSPADPSVCGASLPDTWAFALFLATPVLLLCAPAAGCLSALLMAFLGARYDPVPGMPGWWAVGGVLSAAVLAHLTLIRSRQRRVAAAGTELLPLAAPVDMARPGFGRTRLLYSGAAVVTGIALLLAYQQRVSAKQEHLRRARPADAVVQGLDANNYTLDLHVAGVERPVTVEVGSTGIYRVGQTVPVMADLTGSSPWVRLVAEPEDPGSWLSFAILAFILAGVASLRPARVWWAHRRPLDANRRALLVSLSWPEGDAAVFAVDESGPRLATLRIIDATTTAAPEAGSQIADGARAQGRPAYLIGQLCYSGVVRVLSADRRVTADAIMGLPQLTVLRSWRGAPQPFDFDRVEAPADFGGALTASGGSDATASPGVMRPFTVYRTHRRLIGWICWPLCTLLAVATVLFTVGVILRGDINSGYFAGALLCGLALPVLATITYTATHARLTVSGEGVTVVNAFSRPRDIPWGELEDVVLELMPAGEGVSFLYQLVFTTPDGQVRAYAPLGLPSPDGRLATLAKRILQYRDTARRASPSTSPKASARRKRKSR
jgi:hypothetical protein